MKRILVTGSRDWVNRPLIELGLYAAWIRVGSPDVAELVVGDCPTGADAIAKELWLSKGWPVDEYVALWKLLGKGAGPERNKTMVASGADECVAFIRNRSRGATGCAQLAHDAGIHLTVYRSNSTAGIPLTPWNGGTKGG